MNILPGHKITLRALLFFAAVTLIVYFLPRTDKNHYIYEVNRPWSYALLTAPFDIPVHLDSASVAVLKDSIDRNFEPVYVRPSSPTIPRDSTPPKDWILLRRRKTR